VPTTVITINNIPYQVSETVSDMIELIVKSHKPITQQGYGTVEIDYAPKDARLRLLRKQYELKK
jgi:hypothetical protein